MIPFTRRVLVVDGQQLLAALLVRVLESAGFQARAARDLHDAWDLLEAFDPDAVVLEIELEDGPSGLDLAARLHQEYPHMGLVILTQHPDLRTTGNAADRLPPNCAFLRKELVDDVEQVIGAVNAVLTDDPRHFRHDLLAVHPLAGLTGSQIHILREVSLGLTNASIAARRGVSERAVEKSLQAVFGKLGIRDQDVNPRVEAVRRYVEASGLPRRCGNPQARRPRHHP